MRFNPQDDPLGLAVSGRARERRIANQMTGKTSTIGPLPNPQWDAFFQAADEAAGPRHVRFGQDTDYVPLQQSADALNTGTPFEMTPMRPSNQLGMAPPARTLDALSLRSLKRRGR